MAHVRRRSTKAGSVSTALVESYRDETGRPRQRLIANLHGQPDTVSALAKLIFQRDALRKHRREQRAQTAKKYSADEDFVVEFFAKLDDDLAAMGVEISIIKKHCAATAAEIQAAIKVHKAALDYAVKLATGAFILTWSPGDDYKAAKAKLRRMRS